MQLIWLNRKMSIAALVLDFKSVFKPKDTSITLIDKLLLVKCIHLQGTFRHRDWLVNAWQCYCRWGSFTEWRKTCGKLWSTCSRVCYRAHDPPLPYLSFLQPLSSGRVPSVRQRERGERGESGVLCYTHAPDYLSKMLCLFQRLKFLSLISCSFHLIVFKCKSVCCLP